MSWGDARSFCSGNQTTADLVTIFSPYENNFIKEIAVKIGSHLWIGLSDSMSEKDWVWVDGKNLGPWSNWGGGEPNGGTDENCAEMTENGWNDKICNTKRPFVCKVAASLDPSGDPVLPDTSTMPPTNDCGYNSDMWVENKDTGMCYSLINDRQYTWQDAREYCKQIGGYREGGDLVSIRDQDEQTFLKCELIKTKEFDTSADLPTD